MHMVFTASGNPLCALGNTCAIRDMLVDATHAVPRPVSNLHAISIMNEVENPDINDEKRTIISP